MNKPLSAVAFVCFVIAGFSDVNRLEMINVGLMWFSFAAVVGDNV